MQVLSFNLIRLVGLRVRKDMNSRDELKTRLHSSTQVSIRFALSI